MEKRFLPPVSFSQILAPVMTTSHVSRTILGQIVAQRQTIETSSSILCLATPTYQLLRSISPNNNVISSDLFFTISIPNHDLQDHLVFTCQATRFFSHHFFTQRSFTDFPDAPSGFPYGGTCSGLAQTLQGPVPVKDAPHIQSVRVITARVSASQKQATKGCSNRFSCPLVVSQCPRTTSSHRLFAHFDPVFGGITTFKLRGDPRCFK